MSTFILFWNPEISSYNIHRHRELLANDIIEYGTFNWSIREHENAHAGDRFFLVRCKNKPVPGKLNQWGKQVWEPVIDDTTGICMAGEFISEPYPGEDWSGRGRQTYYVDMNIRQATDPDKFVILKTVDLIDAVPEFDWKDTKSGRLLDEEGAEKLEQLYEAAIAANATEIWEPKLLMMVD